MNVKRGIAFASLAAVMVACGAQSGPAPVATIDPRPNSIVQPQVEYESQQAITGPVTFIEFYAEW